MRRRVSVPRAPGIALLVLGFAVAASADTQIRRVTQGITSLSITDQRLESLGLTLDRLRQSASAERFVGLNPSANHYSFAIPSGVDISFRLRDHGFVGFTDDVRLPHEGGFVLGVEDPHLRQLVSSTALFDFAVEVDPGEGLLARIRGPEGSRSAPLEIRNTGFGFDASSGELVVRGGDLVIGGDWAREIGRPELAGEYVGLYDLRLESQLVRREASDVAPRNPRRGDPPVIDVLLLEVYGLTDYLGRSGTYPNGLLGLSFATTSCNNGNVPVPWHAPMAEDHPVIGMAMFREMNGRMEMIGRSWLKHAFLALANDQCDLGCAGGGGGILDVGCSDTYSAGNNGSLYYLGPRDEVNPHTVVWDCWGSWFDGIPVDCVRDNDGSGSGPTESRLEVRESDLEIPGAKYYYEGIYYVADDDTLFNNFGWREVTTHWNGSDWDFGDVGGGLLANPGPFMLNWGQKQYTDPVAPDDGIVILSEDITDLGGGTWHYEWALYNQTSARAVEAITIPVGNAVITNAGFRDIDQDAENDWTFAASEGLATWETLPYGGPTSSNPVEFQSLYNFWFDADVAPQSASALLRIHRPGTGSHVFLDIRAPHGGTTTVLAPAGDSGFALFPSEPNPFVGSTRISFALDRAQPVRLFVTDVSGRVVRSLVDGVAPSGRTSLRWDGRNDSGSRVAGGIYFFHLESSEDSRTTKGILLR
jgi:hypothetical protein